MSAPERPVTILVAALGGEGGAVMADWLMHAARALGYPAQATSIPGVAQRTGATTYYLEILPVAQADLGEREPVFALAPAPGDVDVIVASELVEAGRALQNGFVSPERTVLIASTHRVYATAEKVHMADGRFDSARVLEAARTLARRTVLGDMRALAEANGTVINAVLFGALAGSGALPLPRAACEEAIRAGGKGVEASLRGFAAGYALAEAGGAAPAPEPRKPLSASAIIDLGLARLRDYQGERYAQLYLARLRSLEADPVLLAETARQLALWMSYEDIIRVADLKSRPGRFARVRREVGAREGEPVIVYDYLKPGIVEAASILPTSLGRRLLRWAEARGRIEAGLPLRIRSSGLFGGLLLRTLARLRPLRPWTLRYREEQERIERWLAAIRRAAARHSELALEIARLASLVRGYGETHRRGLAHFLAIFDALVDNPATDDPLEQAAAIRRAREAALADPQGRALARDLGRPVIWLSQARAGR